mmetsp:Transcript_4378/g.14384  ORF Transcript_4378/g.14384 Transcript_4378/m.14384 type:complete len:203 (+) Transcript_4378:988-1596(+)
MKMDDCAAAPSRKKTATLEWAWANVRTRRIRGGGGNAAICTGSETEASGTDAGSSSALRTAWPSWPPAPKKLGAARDGAEKMIPAQMWDVAGVREGAMASPLPRVEAWPGRVVAGQPSLPPPAPVRMRAASSNAATAPVASPTAVAAATVSSFGMASCCAWGSAAAYRPKARVSCSSAPHASRRTSTAIPGREPLPSRISSA